MGLCPFRVSPAWTDALFAGLENEWYWRTPYVFGGRFQSQGGLDCAGFVCLVFDRIGIDVDPAHELIYTNAQRILEAADPVELGLELPGDLIFFEKTYQTAGASHVGIVTKRGTMLDDHTRNPYGPGYTNYNEPYWKTHFLAVRRVRR